MPAKKRDSSHFGIEPPWTTARCHRLIRPLVSSINALREIDGGMTVRTAIPVHTHISQRQEERLAQRERKVDARDLDWGVQSARKRLKRTYANRDRSVCKTSLGSSIKCSSTRHFRSSEPGEITVQTPLLTRTAGSQPKRLGMASDSHISLTKLPSYVNTTHRWPQGSHVDSGEKIIQGRLVPAFENILAATNIQSKEAMSHSAHSEKSTSTRPVEGPRTLLSLCLRAVPTCISAAEAYRNEEDEDDDTDVSAEIYALLEDLGCAPGQGWKHLREVVRAHAVSILRAAIEEVRFCWNTVSELQTLCWQNNAFVEAEDLYLSYATGQGRIALPASINQTTTLLSTIRADYGRPNMSDNNFGQSCSRIQWRDGNNSRDGRAQLISFEPEVHVRIFQDILEGSNGLRRMKVVNALLLSERLPKEWLATPGSQTFWRDAIRSISEGDDEHHDTTHVVTTALSLASNVPLDLNDHRKQAHSCNEQWRTALENTVLSLCTILTSIALIGHGYADEDGARAVTSRVLRPIRDVSVRIQRDLNENKLHEAQRSHIISRIVILATDMIFSSSSYQVFGSDPVKIFQERFEHIILLNEKLVSMGSQDTNGSEILSNLISSICLCYARGGQGSGFDFLQSTVNHILSYRPRCYVRVREPCVFINTETQRVLPLSHGRRLRTARLFIKQIALSSAMKFASSTNTPQANMFVETVEQSISGSGSLNLVREQLSRTPARRSHGEAGYRWEEGICEWVSATPGMSGVKQSVTVRSMFSNLRHEEPQEEPVVSSPLIERHAVVPRIRTSTTRNSRSASAEEEIYLNTTQQARVSLTSTTDDIPTPIITQQQHVEDDDFSDEANPQTSPIRTSHRKRPTTTTLQHTRLRLFRDNKPPPANTRTQPQDPADSSSEDELSIHEPCPRYPVLGQQQQQQLRSRSHSPKQQGQQYPNERPMLNSKQTPPTTTTVLVVIDAPNTAQKLGMSAASSTRKDYTEYAGSGGKRRKSLRRIALRG